MKWINEASLRKREGIKSIRHIIIISTHSINMSCFPLSVGFPPTLIQKKKKKKPRKPTIFKWGTWKVYNNHLDIFQKNIALSRTLPHPLLQIVFIILHKASIGGFKRKLPRWYKHLFILSARPASKASLLWCPGPHDTECRTQTGLSVEMHGGDLIS